MGGRFRIGASVLVGLVIIAGTYFLRNDVTASTDIEDPRTFVAALPQREYQETQDTDNDGLRDWLEELIGTDPNISNASSTAPLTPKGSTTPFIADTETEKFTISFFEEILKTHGGKNLSSDEKQAVFAKSMRQFSSLNTGTLYLRSNINISEAGNADDVRSYGNDAGGVIVEAGNNPKKVEPELVILGSALEADDAALLADLTIIHEGYTEMISRLLDVSVPEPLIDEHLLLINSMQAVADDIDGFEKAFDDPLVAYLRTKRYASDVKGLTDAIEGIRTTLEKERVVYRAGEAGSFFFSLRP